MCSFCISWAWLISPVSTFGIISVFQKTATCTLKAETKHGCSSFFQISSALLHSWLLVILPSWAYCIQTGMNNTLEGWGGEARGVWSQDKGSEWNTLNGSFTWCLLSPEYSLFKYALRRLLLPRRWSRHPFFYFSHWIQLNILTSCIKQTSEDSERWQKILPSVWDLRTSGPGELSVCSFCLVNLFLGTGEAGNPEMSVGQRRAGGEPGPPLLPSSQRHPTLRVDVGPWTAARRCPLAICLSLAVMRQCPPFPGEWYQRKTAKLENLNKAQTLFNTQNVQVSMENHSSNQGRCQWMRKNNQQMSKLTWHRC